MANTLPLNVPIPASAAVASFNYADISEGTGITRFAGAGHREASTISYYLTTSSPYSTEVIASGGQVSGSTAASRILNANFDITFNRPQNIKGYAYLNLTFGGTATAGTGTPTVYVSGGGISNATTGTTLGSIGNLNNQAIDLSSPAIGTYSKVLNIQIDLTGGPYHFKARETMRLNVQLWGTTTGSAPITHGGIGIDPQDRNDADGLTIADTDPTTLNLYVPFLLNNT